MNSINESIEVVTLMKEIMCLFRQNMTKGFEESGLTAPQGMVIGILSKLGEMNISDLSTKLSLSNSTTSGIIDRLEKQGIVERTKSLEDKRVVFVKISEKYKGMHLDFHKRAEDYIHSIMNKGTPEEIGKVVEGLNILKKLLKN